MTEFFQEIAQAGVLTKCWPPDRMALGLALCKWTRKTLSYHVTDAVFHTSATRSAHSTHEAIAKTLLRVLPTNIAITCEGPNELPGEGWPSRSRAREHRFLKNSLFKGIRTAITTAGDTPVQLTALDLRNNDIGFEREELADLLSCCVAHLKHLNLDNNEITSLPNALRWCTAIVSLSLAYNDLDNYGSTSLAEELRCCTALTWLNLDYTSFGSGDDRANCLALGECTKLRFLSLRAQEGAFSHNTIADTGARSLAAWIGRCAYLTHLDLSMHVLGRVGIIKVVHSVAGHCCQLTHLGLDACMANHEWEGSDAVRCCMLDMGCLQRCSDLSHLALAFCRIDTEDDCRVLADILASCSRLTSLSLSGGTISAGGMQTLLQAPPPAVPALRHLDLSGKHLEAPGFEVMAEGAGWLASLLSLSLDAVLTHGTDSAPRVAPLLEKCTTLTELCLGPTLLQEDTAAALAHLPRLRTLQLNGCPVTSERWLCDAVAGVLKTNSPLESLATAQGELVAVLGNGRRHVILQRGPSV